MVLDLALLQSESSECWGGFVEGLVHRGLRRPCLVIIDGNKGLTAAANRITRKSQPNQIASSEVFLTGGFLLAEQVMRSCDLEIVLGVERGRT